MTTLVATRPIIEAKLAAAAKKDFQHGVLGLRADAAWDGETFTHDGTQVTVAACPSTLAVWEALEGRRDGEWLVILTPVEEDELGTGVLAHLVNGRLLTPDPWDALCANFSAATVEPALYQGRDARALAGGLLGVLPGRAYAPAPAGVLTRDHALTTVARGALHITDDPGVEIDGLTILEWSRRVTAADDFAQFESTAGRDLAVAFRAWLAERSGNLGRAVSALLSSRRIGELVPLGLVAGLLDPDQPAHQLALGRFTERFGLASLRGDELRDWHHEASALVMRTLEPKEARAVLDSAEHHVRDLGMENLAATSELLPLGLAARIDALAAQIDAVLPDEAPSDPAVAVVVAPLDGVEDAWDDVQRHLLAAADRTRRAFAGAVRLVRWLAVADGRPDDLAGLTVKYVESDAWVDAALVHAHLGASAHVPAVTLRAVIDLVAARRARSDTRFATTLAVTPNPTVPVVENLLRSIVFPLAHKQATLLLVIDALSVSAAIEVVRDAVDAGWIEAGVLGSSRRTGALAVLPTLTWRSRCSLLSGELREGQSPVERAGFVAALREAGLQPAAGLPDPIFHKSALDSKPTGHDLATDVKNAIADTHRRPLVAAVLNYVDDTLHHTDPGGTTWNLDTITHLRSLLTAAQSAGRTVVITSDHGHIIERRQSEYRSRKNVYGERAHGDVDNVAPGEVLVQGPRVLTDSDSVVLAVAENIRYGPVNAGYHGGGSPAEVVVPVIALHTGARPKTLSEVTESEPVWWRAPVLESPMPAPVAASKRAGKSVQQAEPSLFDPVEETSASSRTPVVDRVLATPVFAEQLRLAGQIRVSTDRIGALLAALLAQSSRELTVRQAAGLLAVSPTRVSGALWQVKRVLDVEGYEVLVLDQDVVRLDKALLREQFGVSG